MSVCNEGFISRYVAGIVSGIAMVIALIILKESHPGLVDEEGNPRRVKIDSITDFRF